MDNIITVEWITGAELATPEDELAAAAAAMDYFHRAAADPQACQAAWRKQADALIVPEEMTGLAFIFHCAERAADHAATRGWDDPDAGSLRINVARPACVQNFDAAKVEYEDHSRTEWKKFDADWFEWMTSSSSFPLPDPPPVSFPLLFALRRDGDAFISMVTDEPDQSGTGFPVVLVNRRFAHLIPLIEAAPSLHQLLRDVLALFEKWQGVEDARPVGIHACAALIRQRLNQIDPLAGQPARTSG